MTYGAEWLSYQDWRADPGGEPFQTFVLFWGGLDPEAGGRERPVSLTLTLHFSNAAPDGLYSDEEFEALEQLDAALASAFESVGVLYVGRVTGGAKRIYCNYAADRSWVDRLREKLAALEETFPGYGIELDVSEDPEWDLYRGSLEPEAGDSAEESANSP